RVGVVVVARDAERDGGAEGEGRHRVVSLREGERQAGAARGAQEDAADLARADEARGAELAVAEADALNRGRGLGCGRERRRDGAEPFLGVALAGAGGVARGDGGAPGAPGPRPTRDSFAVASPRRAAGARGACGGRGGGAPVPAGQCLRKRNRLGDGRGAARSYTALRGAR